jgi:hypothetical protein
MDSPLISLPFFEKTPDMAHPEGLRNAPSSAAFSAKFAVSPDFIAAEMLFM